MEISREQYRKQGCYHFTKFARWLLKCVSANIQYPIRQNFKAGQEMKFRDVNEAAFSQSMEILRIYTISFFVLSVLASELLSVSDRI